MKSAKITKVSSKGKSCSRKRRRDSENQLRLSQMENILCCTHPKQYRINCITSDVIMVGELKCDTEVYIVPSNLRCRLGTIQCLWWRRSDINNTKPKRDGNRMIAVSLNNYEYLPTQSTSQSDMTEKLQWSPAEAAVYALLRGNDLSKRVPTFLSSVDVKAIRQ